MDFSSIFIKSYRNLRDFKISFIEKKKIEDENLNLNILIGRNGSGKSTLLDALFEIGKNQKNPNAACFGFYILDKNVNPKVICGNRNPNNDSNEPTALEKGWKRLIRFHTGDTKRDHECENIPISEELFYFQKDEIKWALTSLFLSGDWINERKQTESLWKELEDIIFGKSSNPKESLKPEVVWIDLQNFIVSTEEGFNPLKEEHKKLITESMKSLLEYLPEPSFIKVVNLDKTRIFWDLNKIQDNKNRNAFYLLENFFKNYQNHQDDGIQFVNTGFLFKKKYETTNKEISYSDLLPDESLSDGELGLIRRFALIMLLKNEIGIENKCLILLDEPETHFNEYWKTHFIYLLHKSLKKTHHDVFIATHSAMLITDAKREELYRMESRQNESFIYPVPLNTFGANVVDIGIALFRMESDIGERSRQEIVRAINNEDKLIPELHKEKLEEMLKQVGPGEWRWRIRAKLNELGKNE